MSTIRIAWRSIQQRGLASALTIVSMGLGVMLVVAVLLIMGIVSQSFNNNSSLGYNVIVAAKGGRLQVVLNSVYYLSAPVENIPYSFYQEFLPADERPGEQPGEFTDFTAFAIPLCLGDYFQEYRVVGTTEALFDDFVYDHANQRRYEFAEGRNFKTFTPEHGYFEAILGAEVARNTGLGVGDTFSPTHGSPDGDGHDRFFIVGVLKSSGTPNDRAAFVNIEGFLLLDNHAKPVRDRRKFRVTPRPDSRSPNDSGEEPTPDPSTITRDQNSEESQSIFGSVEVVEDLKPGEYDLLIEPDNSELSTALPFPGPAPDAQYTPEQIAKVSKLTPERQALKPLPTAQREVTAILLRTNSVFVVPGLRTIINEGNVAQVVSPMAEITRLFQNFVGPIQWVLLAITAMICVVSGVGILVSIYNSMNDRRREIAVMRALGAGRKVILYIVLLESVMLATIGGILGWIGGHLLIGGLASPTIEERTGVTIGIFDFAPTIKPLEFMVRSPMLDIAISTELLIVPALILLAILVGIWPAITAHRTDVAGTL